MPSYLIARTAIALVWIYQGFWCKLLGRAPCHRDIVEAVPLIGPALASLALAAVGVLECVLAAWVLSGVRAREAAIAQTVVLVAMNTAGLWWGRRLIPDPIGMLLQNLVLVVLAWLVSGQLDFYGNRA